MSTSRARAHPGGTHPAGHFSPVRVNGAVVPLNAWGRVANGHALKDAGVVGWHLDFADPWRGCRGRQISSECCSQRESTFPLLCSTAHVSNNKTPGPLCYTGLGWLLDQSDCMSCGHRTGSTLAPHPACCQLGEQGERAGNAKHLHFTETLKVTDALVSLLRA